MEGINIRQKLHEFIDVIEDKKAEAIYTLLVDEDVDQQRRDLIQAEREKYLRNEGQSYSWNEIKQMALNKDQRHAL